MQSQLWIRLSTMLRLMLRLRLRLRLELLMLRLRLRLGLRLMCTSRQSCWTWRSTVGTVFLCVVLGEDVGHVRSRTTRMLLPIHDLWLPKYVN
jgi:hypothetical protein